MFKKIFYIAAALFSITCYAGENDYFTIDATLASDIWVKSHFGVFNHKSPAIKVYSRNEVLSGCSYDSVCKIILSYTGECASPNNNGTYACEKPIVDIYENIKNTPAVMILIDEYQDSNYTYKFDSESNTVKIMPK